MSRGEISKLLRRHWQPYRRKQMMKSRLVHQLFFNLSPAKKIKHLRSHTCLRLVCGIFLQDVLQSVVGQIEVNLVSSSKATIVHSLIKIEASFFKI